MPSLTHGPSFQVEKPVITEKKQEGERNLWSGRRMGERASGPRERERQRSQYRCRPIIDTGRTRGSEGKVNTFCTFFARGLCSEGSGCRYLHRLPTSDDNTALASDTSQDLFGRDKMPDRMDSRKGAGSYDRDMTTLYCHYGGAGGTATDQLKDLLVANFSEWGPIASIYIVPNKTIAFIRYHWRASAEFAREAMDNQGLAGSDAGEVLSVRWANEDPNPVAIAGKRLRAMDVLESAALAVWDSLPPEEKRARLAAMRLAEGRKLTAVAAAYPDTSAQYGGGGEDGGSGDGAAAAAAAAPGGTQQQQQQGEPGESGWTQEQLQQAWEAYYYQQQQQQEGPWDPGASGGGAQEPPSNIAAMQQYSQYWASVVQGEELEPARQQPKPPAAAAAGGTGSRAAAAAGGAAKEGARGGSGEEEEDGGGALGLLAGYGSDDDDEEEDGKQLEQQQEESKA